MDKAAPLTDPTEDKLWADTFATSFALWCSAEKPWTGGSGGIQSHEDTAGREAVRAADTAVQTYRANKAARAETDPFALCVCGHTRALHDKHPEYSGSCPECHENYIHGRSPRGCRGFRRPPT
jgi:hypothetical protein